MNIKQDFLGKIISVLVIVIIVTILPVTLINLTDWIKLDNLAYASNYLSRNGYSAFAPGVTMPGDLLPTTDNTADIGSTSLRWKNAYLNSFNLVNGSINFLPVWNPGTPITAVVGTTGVLTGNFYYSCTYVSATGETEPGAVTLVSPSSQKVELSNIPISPDSRVTGRKIYRTKAGGDDRQQYLITTINNNSTTSYSDNTPDSSLVTYRPTYNSTAGVISGNGVVRMVADSASTSLGYNALSHHNSLFNTAVGGGALENLDGFVDAFHSGGANVAVGWYAGNALTVGEDNTVVGTGALETATTGTSNVAIGRNALDKLTSGFFNVAVGGVAGRNLTQGSYNVLIGYNAGVSLTTAADCLIIGHNADAPSATIQYQLNIGDFLKGSLPREPNRNMLMYSYETSGNTTIPLMGWYCGTDSGVTDPYTGFGGGNQFKVSYGGHIYATLTTTDPHVANELWCDASDNYTVKVSQP